MTARMVRTQPRIVKKVESPKLNIGDGTPPSSNIATRSKRAMALFLMNLRSWGTS
jgi:hypothetical protein